MKRKLPLLMLLISLLLSACAPAVKNSSGAAEMAHLKMAALAQMPAEVQRASVNVREAYQFAVANPDVLQNVPCYCGCGAMGHTSNYACYVKNDAGGQVEFDQHALGCSICVDITQDTLRMLGQGKDLQEIKLTIDQTYSQYGPSNMP